MLPPEPFGGAPGAPGIVHSQLTILNEAANGISGGYLAKSFVSLLFPFVPDLDAPQYNSGSGRLETLYFTFFKETDLPVAVLLPDTVKYASLALPVGFAIQPVPDFVKDC